MVNNVLRCFFPFYPRPEFWQEVLDDPNDFEFGSDRIRKRLEWAVLQDKSILQADIMFCGGGHAPILCMFLRTVLETPMIFSLQAAIPFRLQELRKEIRDFHMLQFRNFFANNLQNTIVVTNNWFLSVQVLYQTGRAIPVVRNHGLQSSTARQHHFDVNWRRVHNLLPKQLKQNDVALIIPAHMSPRGNMFALYQILQVWAEKLTVSSKRLMFVPYKHRGLDYPRVRSREVSRRSEGRKMTVNAERLQRDFDEIMKDDSAKYISSRDLALDFNAAVLIPWDLNVLTFDELYSSGVAVFMPNLDWLAVIWKSILSWQDNYPVYMLRHLHANASLQGFWEHKPFPDPTTEFIIPHVLESRLKQLPHLNARTIWPPHFIPWSQKQISVSFIHHWLQYSNFMMFPGVHYFTSFPDLVSKLITFDLDQTAETQRLFNRETFHATKEFYRAAAEHLGVGFGVG